VRHIRHYIEHFVLISGHLNSCSSFRLFYTAQGPFPYCWISRLR
jgi:hypothetical protein